MDGSRIGWAASIFAPWVLASGLVVTFAARADTGPNFGGLTLSALRQVVPAFGRPEVEQARFVVGAEADLAAMPDEIAPRIAAKRVVVAWPLVNRARKGDPFLALRPGFEAKAHVSAPPFSDGATPGVPLAFALAALSPSPGEASTSPPRTPAPAWVAAKSDLSDRAGYAQLIDARDRAQQMRCLAEAVYFESRSEPEAGQAAVAQVVLNRVRSGIYPATVCGVVYQDRQRPFACQFSFACEGKSLRIDELASWATATRIAEDVVSGRSYDARFASAINYHAAYVRPFWAATLKRLDRVGLHIFYAMRPGLYWAPGALNGRGDLPPATAAL